jgi:hypothetical protein
MAMKLGFLVTLLATLSSVSAQQQARQQPAQTNGPIAFTIVTSPSPHGSTRSERAAFIYPSASVSGPHIFQIHDIFFGERQGTGFVRWLEGDQRGRALIVRVSFPEGACLDDKDCMTDDCHRHGFDAATCRIYSTILDSCVVETSKLIGCPTRSFNNHDRLAGDVVGPYSYNEAAQPVYDAKKKLFGFQFATHPVPPGIQNRTEVWQIESDGTNAILLGAASTHGCSISPDQSLMMCEEPKGGGGADIVLRKFDGTSFGSILKPDEFERMLDGRWSPDSKFFVYFGEIGPNRTTKLVYQSVEDLAHLGDAKNHKILAGDQTPAVFCPQPQCGPVGNGNLGTDFMAFSPPQPGEKQSKWIAFAVQKQLPGNRYKKVLYGLSLDGSHPKEIELPNDVAYPTFSPDGEWIAFLSVDSPVDPTNPRSQLFVANWKTGRWRQLTHIKDPERQIYNPHWSE